MNFDERYSSLVESYKSVMHKLTDQSILQPSNCMEYFVTHLRFLRDYYILTENLGTPENENLKITNIATAIAEYENYQNCIYKYYKKENNQLVKIIDGTAEEVAAKYDKEKKFHFNCFWQLVAIGMESWNHDIKF